MGDVDGNLTHSGPFGSTTDLLIAPFPRPWADALEYDADNQRRLMVAQWVSSRIHLPAQPGGFRSVTIGVDPGAECVLNVVQADLRFADLLGNILGMHLAGPIQFESRTTPPCTRRGVRRPDLPGWTAGGVGGHSPATTARAPPAKSGSCCPVAPIRAERPPEWPQSGSPLPIHCGIAWLVGGGLPCAATGPGTPCPAGSVPGLAERPVASVCAMVVAAVVEVAGSPTVPKPEPQQVRWGPPRWVVPVGGTAAAPFRSSRCDVGARESDGLRNRACRCPSGGSRWRT